MTFARNMTPIAVIILIAFLGIAWFLFRKPLMGEHSSTHDLEAFDTAALITNKPLLIKGAVVMLGVMVGFIAHGALHIEPATIAFTGATILLLWGGKDVHQALRDVEWVTLFFFIGLFITVEALVEVGLIEMASRALLDLTGGQLQTTAMLLLWMSSIASGIVDNIPYTTAMIPIVENLAKTMPADPLWWSLALGACLGGNATLVGASANIVVANLATRSGYPISFFGFLRYGLITTFVSLILASVYVWVRYL